MAPFLPCCSRVVRNGRWSSRYFSRRLQLSSLKTIASSVRKNTICCVPWCCSGQICMEDLFSGLQWYAVYMAGEGLISCLKKTPSPNRRFWPFSGVGAVSVVLSAINPTGWNAFLVAFSSKYHVLQKRIQEWQSPISFYMNRLSLWITVIWFSCWFSLCCFS